MARKDVILELDTVLNIPTVWGGVMLSGAEFHEETHEPIRDYRFIRLIRKIKKKKVLHKDRGHPGNILLKVCFYQLHVLRKRLFSLVQA